MKKIAGFVFIIALLILTLLQACASFNFDIPQADNPALLYAKFCKGIIHGENPSEVEPVEEGKSFTLNAEEIWLLICLSHLEGHHTMQWKWYAPDNSLFADTGEFAISPEGEFHRLATIWDYISIKEITAEKSLGKWTVAIFLDSKLLATTHFIIRK